MTGMGGTFQIFLLFKICTFHKGIYKSFFVKYLKCNQSPNYLIINYIVKIIVRRFLNIYFSFTCVVLILLAFLWALGSTVSVFLKKTAGGQVMMSYQCLSPGRVLSLCVCAHTCVSTCVDMCVPS